MRHRTFMELLESARAVERSITASQKIRESGRQQGAGTSSKAHRFKRIRESEVSTRQITQQQVMSATFVASSGPNVWREIVCYLCNQPGHFANNCQNRQTGGKVFQPKQRSQPQGSSKAAPKTCYICGQLGHFQRFCPHKTRMPVLVGWTEQQTASIPWSQQPRAPQPVRPVPSAVPQDGARRRGENDRGISLSSVTQGRAYAMQGGLCHARC